jgi:hypothetical protein
VQLAAQRLALLFALGEQPPVRRLERHIGRIQGRDLLAQRLYQALVLGHRLAIPVLGLAQRGLRALERMCLRRQRLLAGV